MLTLSKLDFDSMNLWVDQSAGVAYFIYEGHLLRAPLKR